MASVHRTWSPWSCPGISEKKKISWPSRKVNSTVSARPGSYNVASLAYPDQEPGDKGWWSSRKPLITAEDIGGRCTQTAPQHYFAEVVRMTTPCPDTVLNEAMRISRITSEPGQRKHSKHEYPRGIQPHVNIDRRKSGGFLECHKVHNTGISILVGTISKIFLLVKLEPTAQNECWHILRGRYDKCQRSRTTGSRVHHTADSKALRLIPIIIYALGTLSFSPVSLIENPLGSRIYP